ncbi:DNA-methyltransferase [Geothrix terrae]|uniref:DNA-methyltransferase n=1 Tax=Geothrix terrae TaxID=2922720 RepID=UPI001FABE915|nr:site-specific DNA-methyltransferase [Geothrix terrae]
MKKTPSLPDIKPQSKVAKLNRELYLDNNHTFPIGEVSLAVGMAPTFIRKVVGNKNKLNITDVLELLEQDTYGETFVPRSMVIDYLLSRPKKHDLEAIPTAGLNHILLHGHALDRLAQIPKKSINCVVTSTPYWGLRIYKEPFFAKWADGDYAPYGHEQTPEGFLRHTTEVLAGLFDVLADDGSIWWNVMDSFNTRTQIRGNAVEALRAMQGKDKKAWGDHECRRYSAGHTYLKDGEQCLIPARIAERAARIGFYVKAVITWAKTSTLPEPQESRVSKNLEYVLHLAKIRTPFFNKDVYRTLPAMLGGRNNGWETDKLSDVWTLPTSSGRDGHGAQFPIALPARCIALSTEPNGVVLDPFVGAGNSGVAARALGRKFIGIDVCKEYLITAEKNISNAVPTDMNLIAKQTFQQPSLDIPQ